METPRRRYPELDACRGVAIVMMICYHFFVDFTFLGLPGPNPFTGFLHVFGLLTAILFIGIAGVSAHIKAEKTPEFHTQVIAFGRRGGTLILIGFGITLITWWFLDGEGYVVFGILHLIGTALILAPILHRIGYYGLLLAVGILLVSISGLLPSGPIWMVWFGMIPEHFYSIDFTPLIPWLSVFLIGLSVGKIFYPNGMPRFPVPQKDNALFSAIILAGRHSLPIYLIHQPVLIIALSFLSGKII